MFLVCKSGKMSGTGVSVTKIRILVGQADTNLPEKETNHWPCWLRHSIGVVLGSRQDEKAMWEVGFGAGWRMILAQNYKYWINKKEGRTTSGDKPKHCFQNFCNWLTPHQIMVECKVAADQLQLIYKWSAYCGNWQQALRIFWYSYALVYTI